MGEEQEVTKGEELFHQSATTLTSKIVFELFSSRTERTKREIVDRTEEAIHRIVSFSLKKKLLGGNVFLCASNRSSLSF